MYKYANAYRMNRSSVRLSLSHLHTMHKFITNQHYRISSQSSLLKITKANEISSMRSTALPKQLIKFVWYARRLSLPPGYVTDADTSHTRQPRDFTTGFDSAPSEMLWGNGRRRRIIPRTHSKVFRKINRALCYWCYGPDLVLDISKFAGSPNL